MSEEEIEIQESEEEIEDEVQIETSDLVKWTESEYANQNCDGFQIPVIDGNLDPDIVTRRTPPPQSGASHTLIISEQTALKNYGEVYPPMSIYIDRNKILDDLVRNNPQITSLVDTRNLSDEQLFSTVVLEMSNLWNGKYHGGKLPSTREFEKQTGSKWNTVKQFLHIAETAGLFNSFTRGKRTYKPRTLTTSQQEAEVDKSEFLKNKRVQAWMEENETASQKKNQDTLYNALMLMDTSPDQLYQMAQEENLVARQKIGDLMETPRFKDLRSEENILPKKFMVTRKGKDWQLPKKLMSGTKNTQGAWAWAKFGLQGKPKVWYYTTPDADPNKYKGTKWSLRDWAKSPYAPDIQGTVQEVTFKDEKGKTQRKKLFQGRARKLTEKSLKNKDENVLYDMVGVLRQFLETHGMSFGKVDEDSIWAQVVNPPRSATIHLTIDQLESMKKCLTNGINSGESEVQDYYNYTTPKETKLKFKDAEEAKSYWHDAYFYFLLSLELGFRAEEAFTIIGEETEEVEDTDKSGKSGIVQWDNGDMKVQIYTRKGERGKKGQKIHGGFILSKETKQIIKDRMKEIQDGMQTKDNQTARKFGTVKEHDNKPYTENSLIGASGKYTVLGTLNRPATLQRDDEDRTTVKSTPNRKKLMAILRHCYQESKLDEEYFYKHTLHSLRHMFAQYWLELSEYNYSFVAKIGHWKTESIVKDVYGKDLGSYIIDQMRNFATTDPFKKLHENKLAREKAPSKSEQSAIKGLGFGDEEEMKTKDLKLRETVFFDGGEYWDVRLSMERPTDESLITYYEKGTDLGFKDKSKDNPMKKFILFKTQKQLDKSKEEVKPPKETEDK